MNRHLTYIACGFVASAFFLIPVAKASPDVRVRAGYDLLQTDASNTTFPGLGNLMGVPLDTFNFGGSVGTVNTGQTDTIVQRLADAVAPSLPGTAPTIADLVDALQLETVTPVNFEGLGLNNYFLTLQSVHGGPQSTGTMDISFTNANGGTFNSSLDVFYDIRAGSLTGPIVASSDATITGSASPWSRTAPPGAILIDSINNLLDGADIQQDFWPGNPVTEAGGGFTDSLDASLPEPAAPAVILCIASPLLLRRRRTAF
jgi:hypothetical protein